MKTDLGVCLFNLKAFIFTHPDPDHLTFQYPYTDPALRTWVLNSALETQRGTLQHSTALWGILPISWLHADSTCSLAPDVDPTP